MLQKLNLLKKSNTQKPNKVDYIQVSGNFNFYVELNVVGVSPFQSCNLTANAYTKSDKNYSLPVNFKWFRIRSSRIYELSGVNTNTFHLSTADIGSVIRVEVTPEDDDYTGKAICEFGPVTMDLNLKRNLEALLVNGGSSFSVEIENEKEGKSFNSEFQVSELTLALCEKSKLFNFKIPFSLEQPQIDINSRDSTKIALNFHPLNIETETRIKLAEFCGNVNRINLVFKSRYFRDIACLAIKSLAIKSFLINSKSIASSIDLFTERRLREDPKILDCLIEIEALKKEVNFLIEFSNIQVKAKDKLAKEVKDIEEELNTTISTFNKLFSEIKVAQQHASKNGINVDLSKLSNKADYDVRKKCKELEYEKRQLQRRIDELEGKDIGFFNESMIWVPGEDAISNTNNSIALNPPFFNFTRRNSENENKFEEVNERKAEELSNQLQCLKEKLAKSEKEKEGFALEIRQANEERERLENQLQRYNESSELRSQSQSIINESGYKSIIEFHEEIYNENLKRMESILKERKSQIENLKGEILFLNKKITHVSQENEELKARMCVLPFGGQETLLLREKEALMQENIKLRADLRFAQDRSGSFLHENKLFQNQEDDPKIKSLEMQIASKDKEIADLRTQLRRHQDYSILSRDSSRLEEEAELAYLKGKVKSLEKVNESICLERDQLLVALSKANAKHY